MPITRFFESTKGYDKVLQFRILDGTNKIKNPCDASRSVYFFPDAPYLLKLLRNHCLDKGYSFPDGSGNNVTLGKEDFEKLLMQDGKELKMCPKLTADLIYCLDKDNGVFKGVVVKGSRSKV